MPLGNKPQDFADVAFVKNTEDTGIKMIPKWQKFNTMETRFLGDLDLCTEPKNPFTPITSFFYYQPKVLVVKGGDEGRFLVSSKPTNLEHQVKVVSQLPYHEKKMQATFDENGKSIKVPTWVTKYTNYTIPNKENPFAGHNAGSKLYPGTANKSLSGNARNIKVSAPPLTEGELQQLRSGASYASSVNKHPTLHITNDWETKEFLRKDPEYSSKLIEYIPMSFGTEIRVNEDGKEIVVEAEKNIRLVPVDIDTGWRPVQGLQGEERLAHMRRRLFVWPEFIKIQAARDAERKIYLQSTKYDNMTPEMTKMLEDEQMRAEFEEFMKSKREGASSTNTKTTQAPAQKKKGRPFGKKKN